MQPGDDLPPVPRWFHNEVVGLLGLFPSATISQATTVAWWRHLYRLDPQAVRYGFAKAPAQQEGKDKNFAPSAEVVRDCASAWRPPTQRGDLSRPALPEHDGPSDLDPSNPLHAKLIEIREGGVHGEQLGKAVLAAVIEALK